MNWASSALGAKLVDWSSQVVGGEAINVLEDNENLWLSKPGTPQSVSISMKEVDTIVIRTVGWYCWHPYSTNPRKVSVHVSTDGSHFRHWDTLSAKSHARGNQLFSCAPIDTALYPFIAFEINNTFGGEQTYMNRIYMYSDEITASPDSSIGSHRRSLPVDEGSHSNIGDSRNLHYAEHSYNETDGDIRSPGARSAPRSQVSVRASADTDAVAQQLQAALGIADEWDDSFVHYEDARDGGHVESATEDHNTPTSAVAVAGRIAHLEESVSQLTHTVRSLSQSSSPERATLSRADEDAQHSYYSEQGHPSVGTHSRTSSPIRAHTPSVHRSGGNGALQAYEQRIHQLEDKLVSVLEVLEQRQAAGLPLMPEPTLDTYSSRSPINASTGGPGSKSSSHHDGVRPPQPPPPPTPPAAGQRGGTNQNASYTTISNVTSSSKSTLRPQRDTHAFRARAELPQPVPWPTSISSAHTGAASLQDVEQLLRRVLDRPLVMDGITHADAASSPMRMSAPSHTGHDATHARQARNPAQPLLQLPQHHPQSSPSPAPHILRRAASPTEHVHRDHHAHRNEHHERSHRRERSRDRGTRRAQSREERLVPSSDSDSGSQAERHTSPGLHKDQRDRGVRSYILTNAERLLRQEHSHRPVNTHTEQHHVSQTQQVRDRYEALARAAREGLRGHAVRAGPEDSDSPSADDALLASVRDSDESGAGTTERLRQLRAKRDVAHSGSLGSKGRDEAGGLRPALAGSTSALDKNIFELLKVKYGLDAAAGSGTAEPTDNVERDTASRSVPHQHRGAGAHGAAVRRSSGHNRRTVPGTHHSSTLPMHVPVEASHTMHSSGAVVDWGQYVQNRVASRSGSPASPLRPGTPGVYTVAGVVVNSCDHIDVLARAKHDQRAARRGYDARGVRSSATAQSGATGSGDAEKSRQLHRTAQTEDAEFETLVRQLQEKVLARTIKAAQYDMLRMSEGGLDDN
jgi:hypothetical protein